MVDVAIVGAGPVGLYLASLLEKKLEVVVVDKSREIGKKADSGLYSSNLEKLIPIQDKWVEHEVTGARLHSRNHVVELKKPETAAYVCDREAFQKWLASQLECGIQLGTRVESIEVSGMVKLKTSNGDIEAKMIIGCDGASSIVRKHFGEEPKEILNGIIGITGEPGKEKNVDLYFDTNKIQDGFFWKIPRGSATEYGALGKNVNFHLLEKFFSLKKYEKHAAFMNLGLIRTAFPRTLLVGESACQVKPWSCGGVVYGFTCAETARDVVLEAFRNQDFSEQLLSRYDREWKSRIGSNITLGMAMRSMLKHMTNDRLDSLFKKFSKMEILQKLDMDFPDNILGKEKGIL